MSGPAFAEVAKQRCPDLKVLFMSGHASDALATWEADLLLKPFRKRVLAERVRELLDRA